MIHTKTPPHHGKPARPLATMRPLLQGRQRLRVKMTTFLRAGTANIAARSKIATPTDPLRQPTNSR
jgi:hypothetical protein